MKYIYNYFLITYVILYFHNISVSFEIINKHFNTGKYGNEFFHKRLFNRLSLHMNAKPPITTSQPSILTKQMFEQLNHIENASGAGGSSSINGLIALEQVWNNLKNGGWKKEPTNIVSINHILEQYENKINYSTTSTTTNDNNDVVSDVPMYDIVVCGGTLGVFYAVAMQKLGNS